MQAMHRAHFPYLVAEETDLNFGFALYISSGDLNELQKQKIETILNQESVHYRKELKPYGYFVLDLVSSIRRAGYLITRLLKEGFEFEVTKGSFDLEIYDEGELPYVGENNSISK